MPLHRNAPFHGREHRHRPPFQRHLTAASKTDTIAIAEYRDGVGGLLAKATPLLREGVALHPFDFQ